jgi:hypothetical protein
MFDLQEFAHFELANHKISSWLHYKHTSHGQSSYTTDNYANLYITELDTCGGGRDGEGGGEVGRHLTKRLKEEDLCSVVPQGPYPNHTRVEVPITNHYI